MGAVFDLFGDGKTALKVTMGRYVAKTTTAITQSNNPITTSVNSVTRTWNDTNGNYIPDCDLGNRAANGECLAVSNQNFGGLNITTLYDDDVLRGFGVRGYNWDFTTELQREFTPRLSVSGGYYRNWYGNFTVTKNTLTTPEDYTAVLHHGAARATVARGRRLSDLQPGRCLAGEVRPGLQSGPAGVGVRRPDAGQRLFRDHHECAVRLGRADSAAASISGAR